MQFIFQSLWPMGLSLLLGLCVGHVARRPIPGAGAALKALVILLLFYCGKEFSTVFQAGPAVANILVTAAVYAIFTTALSWGLLLVLLRKGTDPHEGDGSAGARRRWQQAGMDCLVALGTVASGIAVGQYHMPLLDLLSTHQLIYAMVALIGVELVGVPLSEVWRDPIAWATPLVVVAGSVLGGVAAALWTGESLRTSIALASGFGWVTLSSLLVGNALGAEYGAMSMVTDIFRELMAITALYLCGARFSREAIGICGATALDATLPLIRMQCGARHVPLALLSGLALTLASPLLITLCLGGARP